MVFSFTNPKEAHSIELYNITAAFKDADTKEIIEELEPLDLGNLVLADFSTYSLAYEFKIYGGLKDEKFYTYDMELTFSESPEVSL